MLLVAPEGNPDTDVFRTMDFLKNHIAKLYLKTVINRKFRIIDLQAMKVLILNIKNEDIAIS